MTYSPGYSEVVPPMVGPYTLGWSAYPHERVQGTEPSSGTFELANNAAYYPVLMPVTCVARRLWWANGGTVSASYNIDVAIYADAGYKPGVKLISTGSTAQGTANQVQFVDITDTTLAPGLYWLAIACSSASATIFRTQAFAGVDASVRFQETSALPLPATATPVESANTNIYLCGFATTASP